MAVASMWVLQTSCWLHTLMHCFQTVWILKPCMFSISYRRKSLLLCIDETAMSPVLVVPLYRNDAQPVWGVGIVSVQIIQLLMKTKTVYQSVFSVFLWKCRIRDLFTVSSACQIYDCIGFCWLWLSYSLSMRWVWPRWPAICIQVWLPVVYQVSTLGFCLVTYVVDVGDVGQCGLSIDGSAQSYNNDGHMFPTIDSFAIINHHQQTQQSQQPVHQSVVSMQQQQVQQQTSSVHSQPPMVMNCPPQITSNGQQNMRPLGKSTKYFIFRWINEEAACVIGDLVFNECRCIDTGFPYIDLFSFLEQCKLLELAVFMAAAWRVDALPRAWKKKKTGATGSWWIVVEGLNVISCAMLVLNLNRFIDYLLIDCLLGGTIVAL